MLLLNFSISNLVIENQNLGQRVRVRLEWDLLEPQGINPCCPSDVSLLEWWYPPLTFSSIYIQQSYINVPNIPFKLKAFFLLLNKMIRFAKLSAAQCTTSNMNETKIINFFNQCFRERTNIIVHRESCKWRKAGY